MIITRIVLWTEGKKKKSRIVLGMPDKQKYSILVSSPITVEPKLITYEPEEKSVYFSDGDGKTVMRVKTSIGECHSVIVPLLSMHFAFSTIILIDPLTLPRAQ